MLEKYKAEKTVAIVRKERFSWNMKSNENQMKSDEKNDSLTDVPPVKGVDSSELREELSGGLQNHKKTNNQKHLPLSW